MDLNQVLIFERVCNAMSFTAAAHELGIKKSNVSMKIAALEERLGVKLLNRTTRRISLTAAGQDYYEYCQSIISQLEEADERVRQVSNAPSGLLRVVMPMDFGLYCISNFVKGFSSDYPDIILDLKLSHRTVNPNESGVDLVIRPSPTSAAMEDSDLIVKKIFESNLFLYGTKNYLAKKKDYEFIQFDPTETGTLPYSFQKRARQFFGTKTLEDLREKTKYIFSDMYACKEACKAGLGLAVLPSWLVTEKDIQPLDKKLYHERVAFYALYSSKKWLPKKTQVFMDALKIHCEDFT